MLDTMETIYTIAMVLQISYDEAYEACFAMLAATPNPQDGLRYIYQQALAGKSLAQIREGFEQEMRIKELAARELEYVVALYENGMITEEEAKQYVKSRAIHQEKPT